MRRYQYRIDIADIYLSVPKNLLPKFMVHFWIRENEKKKKTPTTHAVGVDIECWEGSLNHNVDFVELAHARHSPASSPLHSLNHNFDRVSIYLHDSDAASSKAIIRRIKGVCFVNTPYSFTSTLHKNHKDTYKSTPPHRLATERCNISKKEITLSSPYGYSRCRDPLSGCPHDGPVGRR